MRLTPSPCLLLRGRVRATRLKHNIVIRGNCYRVFKMMLQPVVGGVLNNILIIFIAAHAHLLLLLLLLPLRSVHTDKIILYYYITTVVIGGLYVYITHAPYTELCGFR